MFNYYVAVDWAIANMAIARMTEKSDDIKVIDVPSSIKEMQIYLKNLKGTICLTFEETSTSQWLYTELKEYVDKLVVCDPYRNKLLSEGPKNDKIDAKKLVMLLRAGLLKEVFHSSDKFIELRKIVSGYEDTIKAGVRLKNQRSSMFRSVNKDHKKETELIIDADKFVLGGVDMQIKYYEAEKLRYKNEFARLKKAHPEIKRLCDIPGIADISAVKLVARIVDANRFPNRNSFLSYCGLIKLEKMSGGKSYGKKTPRFCRPLKAVFKTAALAAIDGDNECGDYCKYLIETKKYSDRNARHALSRRIATITYGVMKGNIKYDALKRRNNIERNKMDTSKT
ncbi:MAG: transposase [Bacteriovoracaceae bacterium]|nr:transposase [Bacteriovoracaceae bacterium]